jgi:hypothetical protein
MDSLQHFIAHVPFQLQATDFKIMCGQFSGLKTLYLVYRPSGQTRLGEHQFPIVLGPEKPTKFWETYQLFAKTCRWQRRAIEP